MPISPALLTHGHLVLSIDLGEDILKTVAQKNYPVLDALLGKMLEENGLLRKKLRDLGDFNHTEYILSLRKAPDDEDGIWHDDGSRNFAFSLGLNLEPQEIEGGELLFRRKGDQEIPHRFPPLPFGSLVVFLTGVWGYEHMVTAVTKGERLICAGWLSQS